MNRKPFCTDRELAEMHRSLDCAGVPQELRRLDANVKVIEHWPWAEQKVVVIEQ